ncbi:hypothetical protein Dsin_000715 [Dipteronia sinensis]|uniref:Uncharacterized protein n=1 Tax=Dipteronia sinensis TaxID=43782 RepID=A0AAE0EI18_9ROSI|nr:hypothetical protein Dsin_000715 [Dipteronia sinensis]
MVKAYEVWKDGPIMETTTFGPVPSLSTNIRLGAKKTYKSTNLKRVARGAISAEVFTVSVLRNARSNLFGGKSEDAPKVEINGKGRKRAGNVVLDVGAASQKKKKSGILVETATVWHNT